MFKQVNEKQDEKQNEEDEDNKSNFTFDFELEKQVGLLTVLFFALNFLIFA